MAQPIQQRQSICIVCDWYERIWIELCWGVTQFASPSLRSDREIAKKAIANQRYPDCTIDSRSNKCPLQFATGNLNSDREIVLAAIRVDSRAFQYASYGLRADREITMAAVERNSGALEHAVSLHQDQEFVTAAIKKDIRAL